MIIYSKKPLLFAFITLTSSVLFGMQDTKKDLLAKRPRCTRKLDFDALATTEMPPAAKIKRGDQPAQKIRPSTQSDSVNTVFTNPDILSHIVQHLYGQDCSNFACVSRACYVTTKKRKAVIQEVLNSKVLLKIMKYFNRSDFCQFARVSRKCHEATVDANIMRAKFIADEASKHDTPMRELLRRAGGTEYVNAEGFTCKTSDAVAVLHRKGIHLFDESISDEKTDLSIATAGTSKLRDIKVTKTAAHLFTAPELASLKIKHVEIDFYGGIDENEIVNRIKQVSETFSDYAISLDLFPSDEDSPSANITESFISKIAAFPILSLTCRDQSFPQGLSCLCALHQLRGLSIINCDLQDDKTIPDELCEGLPLLTFLKIRNSDLTAISPLIDKLVHLATLDLLGNNLTEIPSLPHLHLQSLNLIQNVPIAPEQISKALANTDKLKHLAISYSGPGNPLQSANSLNQLQALQLIGNIAPLVQNRDQLKNLEELSIEDESIHQLPDITQFPSLSLLTGQLDAGVSISFGALCHIAYHRIFCILITTETEEINRIVRLHQLIQMNQELIVNELASCSNPPEHTFMIVKLLLEPSITVSDIQFLLKNTDALENCWLFINDRLAANHHKISLNFISSQVNQRFLIHNELLAEVIKSIISEILIEIPLYNFATKFEVNTLSSYCEANNLATCHLVINRLIDLIASIDQIMKMIENGNTISDEQWDHCAAQVEHCLLGEDAISRSLKLLNNLFFHYAIACNDISNAAKILKHANINAKFLSGNNDTPLYTAIRNRLAATNKDLQQQIDHIIYFLISNGASLDEINNNYEKPTGLIPSDNPLRQQIIAWHEQYKAQQENYEESDVCIDTYSHNSTSTELT